MGLTETTITVDSSIGFTTQDYIQIGDEIIYIISKSGNEFIVRRAEQGTIAVDHYNDATVTLYVPGYTLDRGYKTGNLAGDASIQSYDPITQKAEVVWDYNLSLIHI